MWTVDGGKRNPRGDGSGRHVPWVLVLDGRDRELVVRVVGGNWFCVSHSDRPRGE